MLTPVTEKGIEQLDLLGMCVMQLKLFCIEHFDFVHLNSIAFKVSSKEESL